MENMIVSQHQENYVKNFSAQLFIMVLLFWYLWQFLISLAPLYFLHAYCYDSSCNQCEKYPIINYQIAFVCFWWKNLWSKCAQISFFFAFTGFIPDCIPQSYWAVRAQNYTCTQGTVLRSNPFYNFANLMKGYRLYSIPISFSFLITEWRHKCENN